MDCVWHMGLKFTTFLCHGHTLNKEICINLRDVPLLLILRCLQLQGPGRTFLLRPQIMGDAQSQLGQGPETRRDVMGQWNKTKHVVTHLKIWFYIVSNSPEYWGWDAYWLEPKTQEMEDVSESLSGWHRLKEGKFCSLEFLESLDKTKWWPLGHLYHCFFFEASCVSGLLEATVSSQKVLIPGAQRDLKDQHSMISLGISKVAWKHQSNPFVERVQPGMTIGQ